MEAEARSGPHFRPGPVQARHRMFQDGPGMPCHQRGVAAEHGRQNEAVPVMGAVEEAPLPIVGHRTASSVASTSGTISSGGALKVALSRPQASSPSEPRGSPMLDRDRSPSESRDRGTDRHGRSGSHDPAPYRIPAGADPPPASTRQAGNGRRSGRRSVTAALPCRIPINQLNHRTRRSTAVPCS